MQIDLLFYRCSPEHAETGGHSVCIATTEEQSETFQEMEKTTRIPVQGQREDISHRPTGPLAAT